MRLLAERNRLVPIAQVGGPQAHAANHVGSEQRLLYLMGTPDSLGVVPARGPMVAEVERKPAGKSGRLAGCRSQPNAEFRGRRVVRQLLGKAKMLQGRLAQLLGWGHAFQPAVVAGDGGDRGDLIASRQWCPLAEAEMLFHSSSERGAAYCLEDVQKLSSAHLPTSCIASRLDCALFGCDPARGAEAEKVGGQASRIRNLNPAALGHRGQLDQGVCEVEDEAVDPRLHEPGLVADHAQRNDRRSVSAPTMAALFLACHRLPRLALVRPICVRGQDHTALL
jgi:hypothetical protein